MATAKPRIAVFGSTGGCASSALAQVLRDGHAASALARNPSKLQTRLASLGISQEVIDAQLTVVEGSITDKEAVVQTLRLKDGTVASVILSGLGAYPQMQMSVRTPIKFDNPKICQESTAFILDILKEMAPLSDPPLYIVISTTGISSKTRDYPLAIAPLYRMALHVPHADKAAMESLLCSAPSVTKKSPNPILDSFVCIRPTLLTDGPSKGISEVRSGWEYPENVKEDDSHSAPGPAVGYSISRDDVGVWIAENILKTSDQWKNKMVSITY